MGKTRGEKQKLEKARGKERRKQERFDCDGFAEVVVDDLAFLFRGHIQNLSLGGCYIQSHARLRLDRGAEADLHFTLHGVFFRARARVMTLRTGAGVGFEFLSENPELQERISRLIEKLSAAPIHHLTPAEIASEDSKERGASRNLWDRAH